MLSGNSSNSFFFFDAATLSTPLTLLDENITFSSSFIDSYPNPNLNLSCMQVKYNYVSQKALFITLKYITNNLNRFFILPSIILNLCAFYVLQRTRMNRSSSIAFYMQTLALCDVAFFALRVFFGELWNSSFGQNILSTSLCKFYFLMVNAVNYTTGKWKIVLLIFFFRFDFLFDCWNYREKRDTWKEIRLKDECVNDKKLKKICRWRWQTSVIWWR